MSISAATTIPSDHLLDRLAELESKLREAEADAAAKNDFIAALSRELSNPLAPVLLAMERLRAVVRAGDAQRTEAALLLLERATSGFDRRTRILLSLADITAGIAPPAPVEVDLSTLVEAAAGRHQAAARRAGCCFSAEVAPGLVVIAHAEQLSQVLDDVLANALRFGAGRPVRLCARAADAALAGAGAAVISVIDQGPGMPAEEAARIFTLFHKPRGKLEPGLGVGLWVAARLVAAMGGRIWMESNPGHGAHVHVSLAAPAAAAIAPPAENRQAQNRP